MSPRSITLENLRGLLKGRVQPAQSSERFSGQVFSTGLESLDAILPLQGLPGGSLVEWLGESGAGCECLASYGVASFVQQKGLWCLIPAGHDVYPYQAAMECPLEQCVVIRTQTADETWWAVEQTLRGRGLLTWHWADQAPERVLRRWQLAVERGGGLGMLFRSREVRRQPSWADLRLLVTPLTAHSGAGRRLRIDVVYCRGGFGGQSVVLELNHATGAVRLVSELADSTSAPRAARA